MDEEIERISIGLPNDLKDRVFWVARPYRTNSLSYIPGGTEIIMEYHNGQVLGYDWIKYPIDYINGMEIMKECWSGGNDTNIWDCDFDLFKAKVSGIFIRKYKTENYRTACFEKVWDSANSEDSPLDVIDYFLAKEYR
jgi:hypothetical protein